MVESGMQTSTGPVSIEEFKRLEMRVGTIVEATRVPRTEKLYKVIVDMGSYGRKQTITGLVGYYQAEELVSKRVVFVANLKETKFAGQKSEGMILAAADSEKLTLLTIDRDVPDGARVS
jgi:methionyl-tRNA synthetase